MADQVMEQTNEQENMEQAGIASLDVSALFRSTTGDYFRERLTRRVTVEALGSTVNKNVQLDLIAQAVPINIFNLEVTKSQLEEDQFTVRMRYKPGYTARVTAYGPHAHKFRDIIAKACQINDGREESKYGKVLYFNIAGERRVPVQRNAQGGQRQNNPALNDPNRILSEESMKIEELEVVYEKGKEYIIRMPNSITAEANGGSSTTPRSPFASMGA